MQQFCPARRAFFARPRIFLPVLAPLLVAAGCIERPTTIDAPPDRPHAGAVLTAAASDPADRDFLRQLAVLWSPRSGAQIRVFDTPWDGTADIGLIAPAEMPRWAEIGQLTEAPADFRTPAHAYRWDDLYSAYTVRLTNWRDRTYALPVRGEGRVLVYRLDAFDGMDGRPANPPATWDELAGLAGKHFQGRYLPPLPATSEELLADFFAAAACYDRPAISRFSPGELPERDFFSFQFGVTIGEPQPDEVAGQPRLERPAFRHVAGLLQQMQEHRSTAPDAATAFRTGEAKVGVISLADLGRIGPDVAEKLGVAPVPGARFLFDAKGERRPTDQETINRVPYIGWGGRVGVVSAKCSAPAAAWDFLIDAGLPDRAALDLIAAPRWGAGPYRTSQLDTRSRSRWFGYGLTAAETERLTSALRDNLGVGVQNYRLRLRTPNQHELSAALDDELRAMLKTSTPADQAMRKANARWAEIIKQQPPADWNAVLRKSLGL